MPLTLVTRFTWTPIRESCFLTKFKIPAFRRSGVLPPYRLQARLYDPCNLQGRSDYLAKSDLLGR